MKQHTKGYVSLGKLKQHEYLKTWFIRIVINESINIMRKRKHLHFVAEPIETTYTPEHDKADMMDLQNSIEKLPEKYKTVIILKYFKDMKTDDIASVLKTNSNTVKSRIRRGLENLKGIMGGAYDG